MPKNNILSKHLVRFDFKNNHQNLHCRQVYLSFWTSFRWPLVVVDRWLLFVGRFSTLITWAVFRMAVVYRWSLFVGGC